jgi:hypothetical protein
VTTDRALDIERPGFIEAWRSFWLAPAAPLGLHWIRFLAGLLFLAWLLPLTGEREALFSMSGWFDRTALLESNRLPGGAPVLPGSWSLVYLCGSATSLSILWWGSMAVLCLFTLGLWTRVTSVLTWLVVVSFQANPVIEFDADPLLSALAFYLMLGYLFLGQWDGNLTLRERLLGPAGTSLLAVLRRRGERREGRPSSAANLALRLMQIHFAIAVVISGLHKLQFGDWWSGVAYWYPMHQPFEMDARKLQAEKVGYLAKLSLMSLLQYIALAWQFSFPMIAFRQRWRWLLLAGAAIAWAGTIYIYRMPIFGPLFAIYCLSYLSAAEWRRVADLLLSLIQPRPASASAAERRTRIESSS